MTTMKEAIISKGPHGRVIDSPIPKASEGQVLIKVVVSGSNPKDWKYAGVKAEEFNTGDDIAGTVHALGPDVKGFAVGDRVAAFHQMGQPAGSFAEYAVAWAYTTFHIPDKTSFEEASTLPLVILTSALALYQNLSLPLPWNPASNPTPLIVYGAASAVGSYAIQLAQQSNIHPIIAVAGASTSHVSSLLNSSKGDVVLNYRVGEEKLIEDLKSEIKKAGAEGTYLHAVDAISDASTTQLVAQAIGKGKIATFIPSADKEKLPKDVEVEVTFVGSVHGDLMPANPTPKEEKTGTKVGDKDFGKAIVGLVESGLEKGWLKGHPYEVRAGGLAAVGDALKDLKDGKARAAKYVFRIAETEGVAK